MEVTEESEAKEGLGKIKTLLSSWRKRGRSSEPAVLIIRDGEFRNVPLVSGDQI